MAAFEEELVVGHAENLESGTVPANQAAAAPSSTDTAEKVVLRHPHTQHTVVVNAVAAEMVPYMGRGYQQVKES